MEFIIMDCKRMICLLRESKLPREIVAAQIEYLEETIQEIERIDGLCHTD